MTQPGSVTRSQLDELYASARKARRAREVVRRAAATEPKFRAAVQRHQQALARAEELRELWLAGQRGRVQYSAYARLQARMASMPVVEQAKGIIMAQCGWDADQAFDALRRASQQQNVKVRDLAATIVAATARAGQVPAAGLPAARAEAGAWDVTVRVPVKHRSRRTAAG